MDLPFVYWFSQTDGVYMISDSHHSDSALSEICQLGSVQIQLHFCQIYWTFYTWRMKWSKFHFLEKLFFWSLGFLKLLTLVVSWQDATGWCGIKFLMCYVCKIRH